MMAISAWQSRVGLKETPTKLLNIASHDMVDSKVFASVRARKTQLAIIIADPVCNNERYLRNMRQRSTESLFIAFKDSIKRKYSRAVTFSFRESEHHKHRCIMKHFSYLCEVQKQGMTVSRNENDHHTNFHLLNINSHPINCAPWKPVHRDERMDILRCVSIYAQTPPQSDATW